MATLTIFTSITLAGATTPKPITVEVIEARSGVQHRKLLDDEGEALPELRVSIIKQNAKAYGTQAGFKSESRRYYNRLMERKAYLDRIFSFNSLVMKNGKGLYPVIEEAQNAVTLYNRKTLHTSAFIFEIKRPACLFSTIPTWRDYLLTGFELERYVKLPHSELMPRTESERGLWNRELARGWELGKKQAHLSFIANISRLEQDMAGMIRFKTLLLKGQVSEPIFSDSHQVVVGDATKIYVNDSIYRVVQDSEFELDSKKWDTGRAVSTSYEYEEVVE